MQRIPALLLLTVAALFYAPTALSAQETNNNNNGGVVAHIYYFSEAFAHPGMDAGAEFPLWENSNHRMALSGNIGFFVFPRNTTAIMLYPEFVYRFTFDFGLTLSAHGGLGYMHAFLGAPVYTVSNSQLVEVPDYGKPYLMPIIALGIGWDLEKNGMIPVSIQFKLLALGQYPYNTYMLPRFGFMLGVNYAIE